MTMGEGRNREIRRVFARFGHDVKKLMRIDIGGLRDESLKPGRFRPLRREEVAALRERALRSQTQAAKAPKPVPMREIRQEIKRRYELDQGRRPMPHRRPRRGREAQV
jgi:23S rRNA pseudouridine2605 synthase